MWKQIDQLTLSAKLGLIAILFLIPIGLMIQLFVSQSVTETTFATSERGGISYLRAIWPVFVRATQTDATVADVAALFKTNVTPITEPRAADPKTEDAYQGVLRTLAEPSSPQSSERIRAALRALISRVADVSNLTLDPDIDSYYIMDLVTVKLPDIREDAHILDSAIRDMARDASGAFARKTSVVMAAARLRDATDAAEKSYASALGDNPDGSLAPALSQPSHDARLAAAGLNDLASRLVERIERDPAVDLPQLARLVQALDKQTDSYWQGASTSLDHLLEARIDRLTYRLHTRLGAAIAVILLTFGFVGSVSRSISRHIGRLSQRLKTMAEGDLDSPIPYADAPNEMGRIARSLVTFRDAMASVAAFQAEREADEERLTLLRRADMRRLATAFEESISGIVGILAAAANELEISAEGLNGASDHTGKQSHAAAHATASTTTNVSAVAAASEQLMAAIDDISRQSVQSAAIAGRAVAEATETRANVADLSQFAAKIGGIVSLIDEIASQTNLLALNATIEAARAGESGSGFSVVALEVKQLADQTSRATAQIGDQVAGIQAATSRVAEAIGGIGDTVTELSQSSSAIAASVEQQGSAAREIAERIQQAVQSASDVNRNVARIARATTDSAQSAASILQAAHKLSKQAEFLQSEVGHFLQTVRAA